MRTLLPPALVVLGAAAVAARQSSGCPSAGPQCAHTAASGGCGGNQRKDGGTCAVQCWLGYEPTDVVPIVCHHSTQSDINIDHDSRLGVMMAHGIGEDEAR